jgi:hypothetical protein
MNYGLPRDRPTPSAIPNQESARATIADVVSFLKRDTEYAVEFVEKECQAKKQVVDTVNALIVVVRRCLFHP